MRIKNAIITTCVMSLIVGSTFMYSAYAENKNELKQPSISDLIENNDDELSEITSSLDQFEGKKFNLSGKNIEEVSNKRFSANSSTEVMDEENEEIVRLRTHFNSIEDVEADLESVGSERSTVAHEEEKTMSEYSIDEAKKVYFYSDTLMEEINNNESLDKEDYIWQVPIVNVLGNNGVAYFEEIDESGYLEPSALEFPIDNRELYLNNDKILQIINDYTDDNISEIYFANIPVTVNGVVCAIVELDTNESLFIPIQDLQYYNDMELGEVYTYDEMMDYIDMLK